MSIHNISQSCEEIKVSLHILGIGKGRLQGLHQGQSAQSLCYTNSLAATLLQKCSGKAVSLFRTQVQSRAGITPVDQCQDQRLLRGFLMGKISNLEPTQKFQLLF